MIPAWKWSKTSYNCWTCGDYAVTAYKATEGNRYLSWHRPQATELGEYDSADQARSRCVADAEQRDAA